MTVMTKEELASLAKEAMMRAYAPYSGFFVGAALLASDGKVFLGCNIENAAYSPSNCAERTAFFKAVSEGYRDFTDIAVCGGFHGEITDEVFAPCGVCRQVMREFCKDDFRVHLIRKDGIDTYTLTEILPVSFRPERLSGI